MILFDYVYYLCCRLYRRSKWERDIDEWRASGVILTSLFASCISLDMIFIVQEIFEFNLGSVIYIIISVLVLLLNILRYNKFTCYADIHEQVLTFSNRKKLILNIAAGIYMFVGFPGALILAIVLGATIR